MKSTKSSEKDLNPLNILKTVTWPLGVWPLSDDLFSTFRIFLFIIIQISLVTCVTIEIILGCTNADEAIDYIELQKFGTVAAFKVILFRFYRKNMARIISSVKDDWSSMKTPKMFQIMKTYASLGHFVFYAQTISNFTICFLQIASSLSSFSSTIQNNSTNNSDDIFSEKVLPLKTRCLFLDISITSYIAVYILQAIQLFSTSVGNVGIDIFFFNLVMHVCGQLEILSQEISDIGNEDCVKETKFRIVALIKRHQNLLRKTQSLKETFSIIIMMQLLINITGICAYGIQGIITIQKYGALAGIKSFVAIELLIMQLLLYCYGGEILSSRVTILSLATYQSSWYNLPNNLSQNVYFIMMIAAVPSQLTAGKLLTMNMNTFSSIIKATASYFSVLRLMLDT